ncbi:hypothetical protein BCR35DRAFT_16802 [Leucosporidium creatinivorum]|uniref:HAT C-terminal dimerisation domain-containing protein n=1 Tax=Leucosporidium creatinivorum TaxID=106004 RepID=A0A1Y2D477_9BASI|nr:hypothetical protein BCR35DRAFT_16802 [Leucosporidium creatinivorum]
MCFTEKDFLVITDLLEVLKIFDTMTRHMSVHGAARLADTIPFIDRLTDGLSVVITNQFKPAALRNACVDALRLVNKYYAFTDSCPLIKQALLAHPSYRYWYLNAAEWEKEWIETAKEGFIKRYKALLAAQAAVAAPVAVEAAPAPSSTTTSSIFQKARAAAAAAPPAPVVDALEEFIMAQPIYTASGEAVDGIKFHLAVMREKGANHVFSRMCLDILSAPASLVDVERAFNHGRNLVSLRRFRLSNKSVVRGMAVAAYSREGWIKRRILWDGQKARKEAKAAKRNAVKRVRDLASPEQEEEQQRTPIRPPKKKARAPAAEDEEEDDSDALDGVEVIEEAPKKGKGKGKGKAAPAAKPRRVPAKAATVATRKAKRRERDGSDESD